MTNTNNEEAITQKQYNLIAKTVREHKLDIEMSKVSEFSKREASALLDEILDSKPRSQPTPYKQTTVSVYKKSDSESKSKNSDRIQLGMVKKFVAAQMGLEAVMTNPRVYAENCREVYMSFNLADSVTDDAVSLGDGF